MIRRLLDRLLPDEIFSGIGRVNWRLVDLPSSPPSDALVADGGLCAPLTLVPGLVGSPMSGWDPFTGAPRRWRPWPDVRVRDLLPAFSASRGGIRFVEPPSVPPSLPWSGPHSDPLGDVLAHADEVESAYRRRTR